MRCFAAMAAISSSVMRFFRSESAPADLFETLPMQEPFAPRPLPASTLLRFHPTSAPAFAAADLPSSRAELSKRAMSLCPVPPGASQNDFGASVLVSAAMTRLTTGDLSVRSFEAYIRDFTFVWLIPLSSWASARRSPSAQPTFLSACRFLCRTDSFHSVSSAELRLAHHGLIPFVEQKLIFSASPRLHNLRVQRRRHSPLDSLVAFAKHGGFGGAEARRFLRKNEGMREIDGPRASDRETAF